MQSLQVVPAFSPHLMVRMYQCEFLVCSIHKDVAPRRNCVSLAGVCSLLILCCTMVAVQKLMNEEKISKTIKS